jgi:hypothetical protein
MDRTRLRTQSLDDEVDGMSLVDLESGFRENHRTEPTVAVNVGRIPSLTRQRLGGALGNGHRIEAEVLAQLQSVPRGVLQSDVAAHGRDADELDGRVTMRQQQRERIIQSRVAVDEHLVGHGMSVAAQLQASASSTVAAIASTTPPSCTRFNRSRNTMRASTIVATGYKPMSTETTARLPD